MLTGLMLTGVTLTSAMLTSPWAQADTQPSAAARALLPAFGPWPQAMPPDAGNELSGLAWAETLGEQLFSDTALSGGNLHSCSSCHDAERAFTDGLPVAVAADIHVRNTLGLLDVGHQRWFGWDGGADSQWAATLRPMLSDIELDADIPTVAARLRNRPAVMQTLEQAQRALDDDESLVVLANKAIAAYLRTLQSDRTPFDHYRDAVVDEREDTSDYPMEARRGMSLFFGEANCHLCHFGPNFSNRDFHDTGARSLRVWAKWILGDTPASSACAPIATIWMAHSTAPTLLMKSARRPA